MYSMELKEFGEKLPAIVALYEEHCWNRENPRSVAKFFRHSTSKILEILKGWWDAFRIGSRWSEHTKLELYYRNWIISVLLRLNFDPWGKSWSIYKEALREEELFNAAVKKILDWDQEK